VVLDPDTVELWELLSTEVTDAELLEEMAVVVCVDELDEELD
jgi:hypothetical protein